MESVSVTSAFPSAASRLRSDVQSIARSGDRHHTDEMQARIWRALIIVVPVTLAAGCQARPPADSAAAVQEIQALTRPGLHNLFRVSERIYSGSNPEGDEGFASLVQLGIKTVISVDGAKPDVKTAARHGLEYVHLPFGYDGVPRNRVLELAKAASVRPAPIYVHCHHGLHRGPVAVAVIELCENPAWNSGTAELWLQQAGTSPQYPGLMRMPRNVVRPTKSELAAVSGEFPEKTSVNDVAALMVDVDARWDRLKLLKSAGWKVPDSQPDLDPPNEALQLVESFRESARLDSVQKRGSEFVRMFKDAENAARELETQLRASPVKADMATKAFARIAASCAACHNQFRDRPSVP